MSYPSMSASAPLEDVTGQETGSEFSDSGSFVEEEPSAIHELQRQLPEGITPSFNNPDGTVKLSAKVDEETFKRLSEHPNNGMMARWIRERTGLAVESHQVRIDFDQETNSITVIVSRQKLKELLG